MDFPETILRTDPRRFNPFREGNVLAKLTAELTLEDSSLVVYAASAFYPVTATIVQSVFDPRFFRDTTLKKVSTMEGFSALVTGEADILVATAPSDEQRAAMDASGLRFRYVTLCEEPLVLLANRANPVDDLTVGQVRDMYFDRLTDWSEAGGPAMPVNTYQLEKNNGSQTAFESIVKNNPMTGRHHEIATMPAIVDAVARDVSGICYAFWSYYTKMYANRNTKILNVDDRGPTADDYPLMYPLYLMYREDDPKPATEALAGWLETEPGRELIRRSNLCWRSV